MGCYIAVHHLEEKDHAIKNMNGSAISVLLYLL